MGRVDSSVPVTRLSISRAYPSFSSGYYSHPQYKEIARQDGTELDEEILFATFGPERLKEYQAFFPHRQ
jgi:hypothetical protein